MDWTAWGSNPSRVRDFSCLQNIQTGSGIIIIIIIIIITTTTTTTQPPSQLVLLVFPGGVKWMECEVKHLSPSSTKVMSEWSHTSAPVSLHGMDRDNFNLFVRLPKQ